MKSLSLLLALGAALMVGGCGSSMGGGDPTAGANTAPPASSVGNRPGTEGAPPAPPASTSGTTGAAMPGRTR